ncbi:dTDP-4-dehydrorhamnose reductase [Sphaerisporangium sp. TRM90804]|uniref:dTDP-4-dehydrorhamnose reductase n=1 Tax=Sphaerisporangium sp. TRM90804 TaxID=3031113 RepID=UPI00244915AE|nr:dTDP-4-dehydrorhamnose reductase [Sphaerisporangium sp. TRM90804]MDH2428931.1 dTDP-4-dehydrorhamnose reductase [Sphaerisporangium sp. TRM90804]
MTRILVTGARGMLGTALVAALEAERDAEAPSPAAGDGSAVRISPDWRGCDILAFGRDRLDLGDPQAVVETVHREKPDVVFNCAAWTAVDDAEAREGEALAVNGTGARALASACADLGTRLVHVSTDYVFDGTTPAPYPEDAPTAPVNAYGRTKLAGERAVLELLPDTGYVVRTAWLYGGGPGSDFVRTMVKLAGVRETVNVVDDQRGQPTCTHDLAAQLVRLARAEAPPGVYHGTSSGQTTWYHLAREVFTLLGADPARVRPTTSADFPRPAARPANSVLAHTRWHEAGLPAMRDWRAALRAAWPRLT